MRWLAQERPKLGGTAKPALIQSLNVPTCASGGSVRGELTLPQQKTLLTGQSILGASDCTSTATPDAEVAAFTDGYATLVTISAEPAS